MSKVKVRNLHDQEHVEMFRDEEVRIPANGYVEMGRAEAVTFLGQITPLNVDGSGQCVRPKRLVLDEDPEAHAEARDQPIRFHAPDGTGFRTQKGHDMYVETLQAEAKEVKDAKPVRRRRAPNSTTSEARTA